MYDASHLQCLASRGGATNILPYVLHMGISHSHSFEMTPRVSVNFISLVTSYVRLREEEPQTAFPTSFTWTSHIAASVFMGH